MQNFAFKTSKSSMNERFFPSTKPQTYTLITGATGSGKTIRGIDLILNALREGKAAIVVDHGYSYKNLCQIVGGTYTTLPPEGGPDKAVYGDCPLTVYECESFAHRVVSQIALPEQLQAASNTLLLVDELWYAAKLLPDLSNHIKLHLQTGGDVALVCPDFSASDCELLSHYLTMEIPSTVYKSVVTLGHC